MAERLAEDARAQAAVAAARRALETAQVQLSQSQQRLLDLGKEIRRGRVTSGDRVADVLIAQHLFWGEGRSDLLERDIDELRTFIDRVTVLAGQTVRISEPQHPHRTPGAIIAVQGELDAQEPVYLEFPTSERFIYTVTVQFSGPHQEGYPDGRTRVVKPKDGERETCAEIDHQLITSIKRVDDEVVPPQTDTTPLPPLG